MTTAFINALKNRRTYYALKKEPLSSDEQIRELVEQAVLHVPSSFNSQSARVAILLGSQHDRLWNLTKTELQKIVPPEHFAPTEEKINSAFLSGYGTILYFEDMQVLRDSNSNSRHTATTFRSGRSSPQACFSLQSGLLWSCKAGALHYSTIIR